MFGQISLRSNAGVLMKFPNPYQHSVQKELLDLIKEEESKKEEEERRRMIKMITRSPFLEND